MAKKGRRPQKGRKRQSRKWSRANLLNYIAGAVIAASMVLGSVFVFGGGTPPNNVPPPTPVIATPTSAQSTTAVATVTVTVTAAPTGAATVTTATP